MISVLEWGDGGFAGDGAKVELLRSCVDLEDDKAVCGKLLEYVTLETFRHDQRCGCWFVAERDIDIGG